MSILEFNIFLLLLFMIGFQMECRNKYDNITFGMFVQIFHNLPIMTVINDVILVVHGGLFHSQDVTLAELNAIDRKEFTLCDLHLDAASTDAVDRVHHHGIYV